MSKERNKLKMFGALQRGHTDELQPTALEKVGANVDLFS